MAEALLNSKGKGRFRAESAGSAPAREVNQFAVDALRAHHIPWNGRAPRGLDGLEREAWDLVITVCDQAREACPIFPGQPIIAHWGMEDPAAVAGSDAEKRRAFHEAYVTLARRIDLLVAVPTERLQRLALQARVRAIGGEASPRHVG